MRGFALGLSLSVAFIIGCLAGPYLAPAASAQPRPRAQRYQYHCIEGHDNVQRLQERMNEKASRGWELVAVAAHGTWPNRAQWCFRR